MTYWDIRKRAQLQYLPPPEPETVRSGVSDSDARFLRSREWIKLYNAEKAQQERPPDDQSSKKNDDHGLMAHADASSGEHEASESGADAATGAGGEFAPR